MSKIRIILSLACSCMLSSASAQESKIEDSFLGINMQFHESDTTRTFALISGHTDRRIQHFIDQHHLVDQDGLEGLYSFKSIEIPALGSNLTVFIKDGILSTSPDKHSSYFEPFKSKSEKSDRLQNLKTNEQRVVEILILDKNDNNIINSDEEQAIAEQYLYSVLKI